MAQLDNRYDALVWGSHLTPLMACVAASRDTVLEVGIGHFSTPVLHAVCAAMGRKLISIEADKEWYDTFERYADENHLMLHGEYEPTISSLADVFGVAFIDHSPGGQSRANVFKMLLPSSDFVVMHDYELDNKEALEPIIGKISHRVYNEYRPPTLIASGFRFINLDKLSL